jgi:hypothetical protein
MVKVLLSVAEKDIYIT